MPPSPRACSTQSRQKNLHKFRQLIKGLGKGIEEAYEPDASDVARVLLQYPRETAMTTRSKRATGFGLRGGANEALFPSGP